MHASETQVREFGCTEEAAMTRPTRARTPMVGAGGQEQEEQCAQRALRRRPDR